MNRSRLHWRALGIAAAGLGAAAVSRSSVAATWREEFSTDPLTSGSWRIHGEADLFRWQADPGRLAVTWDSTRTNSFFYRPLGTVLSRADEFRVAFTLAVDEAGFPTGNGSFPIAISLLRMADATAPNSFRGSGVHAQWGVRNVVEFAYFPESPSITPTLSGVVVNSTNRRWEMVNLHPFALHPGRTYRVELRNLPALRRFEMSVTEDGLTYAAGAFLYRSDFGDFRVDALAVSSYSGEHQPLEYGAQVLARGWVDAVEMEHPDPPSSALTLERDPAGWTVTVAGAGDWVPALEESTDFRSWEPTGVAGASTAAGWRFDDRRERANEHLFYRVRWEKP